MVRPCQLALLSEAAPRPRVPPTPKRPRVHRMHYERQVIMNKLDDLGPTTANALWAIVEKELPALHSKRAMKLMLQFLQKRHLVVARPPEDKGAGASFTYRTSDKFLRRRNLEKMHALGLAGRVGTPEDEPDDATASSSSSSQTATTM